MKTKFLGLCIVLIIVGLTSCLSVIPTDSNGKRLKDSECVITNIEQIFETKKADKQLLKDLKTNLGKLYTNTINSSGASIFGPDAALSYSNFNDAINESAKTPLQDTSMLLTMIDLSRPGWKLQYSIQLDFKDNRVRMILSDFHGFITNPTTKKLVEARINNNAFWYTVYKNATDSTIAAIKSSCEDSSKTDW